MATPQPVLTHSFVVWPLLLVSSSPLSPVMIVDECNYGHFYDVIFVIIVPVFLDRALMPSELPCIRQLEPLAQPVGQETSPTSIAGGQKSIAFLSYKYKIIRRILLVATHFFSLVERIDNRITLLNLDGPDLCTRDVAVKLRTYRQDRFYALLPQLSPCWGHGSRSGLLPYFWSSLSCANGYIRPSLPSSCTPRWSLPDDVKRGP